MEIKIKMEYGERKGGRGKVNGVRLDWDEIV